MFDENYLLDKKVKIFQPKDNYHASSDAVWLSAAVKEIKKGAKILDVGSGTGAVSLCLAERFKTFEPQIVGLEIQPLLAEAANLSAKANNFDFLSFINKDIFCFGNCENSLSSRNICKNYIFYDAARSI